MLTRMRRRYWLILLLFPVLLAQSDNGMCNSKGRTRGKTSGGFSLKIAGDFSGTGTALVTPASVSLNAAVTLRDGSKGMITFGNLALVNDRFQGQTTFKGHLMKIWGRVDLPSARDDQETPSQAVTARVIATMADGEGRVGRLVAIQDAGSRGGDGTGNGMMNGNMNGNENGKGNINAPN
jgi:hypothetical protein